MARQKAMARADFQADSQTYFDVHIYIIINMII